MEIEFKQSLDDCLHILQSAARWRQENNIVYSQYWDPELLTKKLYLQEFYEHQTYVLYIDSKPIATATLADPAERKISVWKDEPDKTYAARTSLYLDSLAVVREQIGNGIINILFDKIEKFAVQKDYLSMRIDVDARLAKLIRCYEKIGFSENYRGNIGSRVSLYMEKNLIDLYPPKESAEGTSTPGL